MPGDTIAACATALNNTGISVIRVSGSESVIIVNRIFKSKNMRDILPNMESHTIRYGYIFSDDEIVDEVMVSLMKAPKSYTREDVVEISCHGGIIVTNKILSLVIKNGARAAEPGEFTKRAFLNGRIDLSQAEAIIDIINAKNDMAVQNSISQLRGNVFKKVEDIRNGVLREAAYIEAALDDPEHISLESYSDIIYKKICEYKSSIKVLLKSADEGKIIKEGIKTVILGKPNAGKSSLLNYMSGEERAIVTEAAGTTRDIIEESININGISINILDTAGIRATDDIVEKIGIEKAVKAAEGADLILYIVDSSIPLDENDRSIIKFIRDRNAIVLLNKSDLKAVIDDNFIKEETGKIVIKISAINEYGIDILYNEITDMFFKGKVNFNDEIYISNIRHKEALMRAYESLERVEEALDVGMPEDIYSIDLAGCCDALGKITGESIDDDLINMIFTEFCMGK